MNLRAADLEMFEKLRISPGLLALAGVQRVSDQEAREDFGIVCAGDASGIVFPYQRNGHRVTCRLRRDFSEVDSKGKPKAKYISPKGDTRALYFLPGSDELLRDPSVPLLFVEAEKSVLAVTEWALRMNVRILPLGTGGCYGWRGKTGIKVNANGEREPEKGALAEVSFAKDGRIAGLLFDANATSNRKVRAARESFAALLRTQGAKVQVFTLPAGPWNGPDDYIASEGDSIFLDLLNRKPSDSKPTIICGAGDASTAADEAEKILLEHAEQLRIYQRSGQVVRITRLPEPRTGEGLKRPAGTVLIEPVSKVMLLEALTRLVTFQKLSGRRLKIIDCPARVADFYLSRTGSRRLPVLVGTVFTPFLRDDGSVVETDGYDIATGLYLLSSESWLPVPDAPTKHDALAALGVLMEPFNQFPWCKPVDLSVHLAALFTIVQRRLLSTAPLFSFSAPMQRSGKSMLADSISILGTGHPAPCQTVSSESEEFRKVVFASLYEGHLVINLDNIERPLASPHLSIALTQATYSDRPLGQSSTVHLPTRMVWLATGCNLSFRGDLAVRTLLCHIDAHSENPEEREFKIPDLSEYLKKNRPQLVQAVLTVLRAYHIAGRPVQNIKNWGGFDEWSRAIRAPLVWLGLPDPADTREATIHDDPDRDASVVLLHALHKAFGDEPFTLAEAVRRSKDTLGGYGYLEEALKSVAERKGSVDLRALGWWLRRWKGRVADGLCLCDTGRQQQRAVQWRVEVRQ